MTLTFLQLIASRTIAIATNCSYLAYSILREKFGDSSNLCPDGLVIVTGLYQNQ